MVIRRGGVTDIAGMLHVKKSFTAISQLHALATHKLLGSATQGALELCLQQIR